MKIKVDVYGDEIGYFSLNFIEYPENFERNIIEQLNVGNFITVISFFVTFIFGIVGVFIIFLKKFIKGEDVIIKGVRWKLFIPLSVIVFIIGFLMDFNLLPIAISNYDTTQSYINYMGNLLISYIVIAFSYAGFVFFLGPLSEFISRDMNPKTTAFFDFFRGEPKEKEIRRSVIIGLMFAVICFGYVVSFYVIGSRYFGVWSFIGSSYSSSFDSLIPFLYPLGIGVIASVTEEFGYRLFFIPMLKKYFKLGMMSFIIPAILWSFAHSTYAVFPIYVRGIEIGILGIVYGIIYMNFGILATIISHCTYNAIVTSIPLLVSMNFYYMLSAVLAILSVPLTIFLITLIRGKKNS